MKERVPIKYLAYPTHVAARCGALEYGGSAPPSGPRLDAALRVNPHTTIKCRVTSHTIRGVAVDMSPREFTRLITRRGEGI